MVVKLSDGSQRIVEGSYDSLVARLLDGHLTGSARVLADCEVKAVDGSTFRFGDIVESRDV